MTRWWRGRDPLVVAVAALSLILVLMAVGLNQLQRAVTAGQGARDRQVTLLTEQLAVVNATLGGLEGDRRAQQKFIAALLARQRVLRVQITRLTIRSTVTATTTRFVVVAPAPQPTATVTVSVTPKPSPTRTVTCGLLCLR